MTFMIDREIWREYSSRQRTERGEEPGAPAGNPRSHGESVRGVQLEASRVLHASHPIVLRVCVDRSNLDRHRKRVPPI